jgi:hypothetical protein
VTSHASWSLSGSAPTPPAWGITGGKRGITAVIDAVALGRRGGHVDDHLPARLGPALGEWWCEVTGWLGHASSVADRKPVDDGVAIPYLRR